MWCHHLLSLDLSRSFSTDNTVDVFRSTRGVGGTGIREGLSSLFCRFLVSVFPGVFFFVRLFFFLARVRVCGWVKGSTQPHAPYIQSAAVSILTGSF